MALFFSKLTDFLKYNFVDDFFDDIWQAEKSSLIKLFFAIFSLRLIQKNEFSVNKK